MPLEVGNFGRNHHRCRQRGTLGKDLPIVTFEGASHRYHRIETFVGAASHPIVTFEEENRPTETFEGNLRRREIFEENRRTETFEEENHRSTEVLPTEIFEPMVVHRIIGATFEIERKEYPTQIETFGTVIRLAVMFIRIQTKIEETIETHPLEMHHHFIENLLLGQGQGYHQHPRLEMAPHRETPIFGMDHPFVMVHREMGRSEMDRRGMYLLGKGPRERHHSTNEKHHLVRWIEVDQPNLH